MAPGSASPHAVVVLPAGLHGRIRQPAKRRWLAGGRLEIGERTTSILATVLQAIGQQPMAEGLAALRLWGQTGQRPDSWVAAADPVHLEARLDHLCLHALQRGALAESETGALFEHLQATLGSAGWLAFTSIGHCGYVRGLDRFATAEFAPLALDGSRPDDFLPRGDAADAHDRLLGEVQLALHEHAVNRQLVTLGRLAVNSLWFWGGGVAPEIRTRPLPALFADDPLTRGYWHSGNGRVAEFPQSFARCREQASGDFVAVTPEDNDDPSGALLETYLDELSSMLRARELGGLTLRFRDGLAIELRKHDALRFWRRVPNVLQVAKDDV